MKKDCANMLVMPASKSRGSRTCFKRKGPASRLYNMHAEFHILIVADAPVLAGEMRAALTAEGHSVAISLGRDAALFKCRQKAPDLVLICTWPVEAGMQLVEKISHSYPETEFITIAGHAPPISPPAVSGNKKIIACEARPFKMTSLCALIRQVRARQQAENEIKTREKYYRLLAENTTDVIWTADMGSRLTYISPSVQRLRGYSSAETAAQTMEDILPPEVAEAARDVMERLKSGDEQLYHLLCTSAIVNADICCRNGAKVSTVTRVTLVPGLHNQTDSFIGVTQDISARKNAEEQLQSLSRRLVQAQEDERRAIARELHDQIGQMVTVLKLLLDRGALSPETASAAVKEARGVAGDLMGLVRNMSLELRPAMLDDLGLLPTLHWHFERYTAKTQVHVKFQHSGLEKGFPTEVSTAAYRIVQEALTNCLRHAAVNEIAVYVGADEDTLTLRVEDKGKGFDPASVLGSRSSGLRGMRERAQLLGGRMLVESAPGAGTTIIAELPLGSGQK